MNSKAITTEVRLSLNELVSKLKDITVEDFDMVRQSPHAVYYGEITSHFFKVKHVRYSPLSESSNIDGEIIESLNDRTIIKLNMDIKEPYVLIRKMYYSTLIPIGLIVMLLSVLVMWGTEFQWQSLLLSSSFIIVAFLAVLLYRTTLVSMKKKELKDFISRIDGKIISDTNG
ncbi:MAG: hypothetical protein K8F54_13605 [Altibacter sp.]|uniref:hypothetical protein n=1 Tax=Altibacter sp. TaxID=2024823 RepID=UPI001D34225B|nr:hypothetical protein [Altibacter sp.]MBZ0328638.1 hypothetical protein [Altibacter sp.]